MMAPKLSNTWLSGLVEKPKAAKKIVHALQKKCPPKYPKPMLKEVVDALANLERWLAYWGVKEDVTTALADYRAHVSWGVLSPMFIRKYSEDTGLIEAFCRLDKAYAALHNYRPEDYLTQSTMTAAGSFYKKGQYHDGRKRSKELLAQFKYLQAPRGNIDTEGTQAWIRKHIADVTDQSESTIVNIIREWKKEISKV